MDFESSAEIERILIESIDEELIEICGKIQDLVEDMNDGVRLIYLVSSLNDSFVPLSMYHSKPINEEEKTKNIEFALQLMIEQGISMTGIQSMHVLKKDKKIILRILYV